MRHGPVGIIAIYALVAAAAVPVTAQPPQAPGACGQIRAACKDAGFTLGGMSTGTGLLADCVIPIMQGIAQPAAATRPLPPVTPQVVAACKASNPQFGQAKVPTPPTQVLPVPARMTLPLATPAPTPAHVPPNASTVTPLPVASLAARPVPASGTGSFAVEIETTLGGKTAVGNATSVKLANPVVVQFAQDDQLVRPVEACFAENCILDLVTITQTGHSSTATVRLPEYVLTTATVSHLGRGTCAGDVTGKPCAGPIIVTFAYRKLDVRYPPAASR